MEESGIALGGKEEKGKGRERERQGQRVSLLYREKHQSEDHLEEREESMESMASPLYRYVLPFPFLLLLLYSLFQLN